MANWSKNFTQPSNVNGGNEFQLTDYPSTNGFNAPINNTFYLYENCVGTYTQNLSSAQKQKARENIGAGTPITVDSTLGNTTNPIQNSAVNEAVNTINQRLDDLGFSEGMFTTLSVDSGHSSFNVNITKNKIVKQGKRCIANFEATLSCSGTGVFELKLGLDNNNFKPKENTIVVPVNQYTSYGIPIYEVFGSQISYITTDGILSIILNKNVSSSATYYFKIYNTGWEL